MLAATPEQVGSILETLLGPEDRAVLRERIAAYFLESWRVALADGGDGWAPGDERGRVDLRESCARCGALPLPLKTRQLTPDVVDAGAVRAEPERREDLGVAGMAAVAAEQERALRPGCRRQCIVAAALLHARTDRAGGTEPAPMELHAQATTLEGARELVDADRHDARRLRSNVVKTSPSRRA
jgi:hypothetical protein